MLCPCFACPQRATNTRTRQNKCTNQPTAFSARIADCGRHDQPPTHQYGTVSHSPWQTSNCTLALYPSTLELQNTNASSHAVAHDVGGPVVVVRSPGVDSECLLITLPYPPAPAPPRRLARLNSGCAQQRQRLLKAIAFLWLQQCNTQININKRAST